MRIACIGGGPAGLYFAILMKARFPGSEITVHERNRADDTFGWGVVFSDETLGVFQEADPQSFRAITDHFATWTDIETFVGDACVRSTGHGFCGMSRKLLLQILHGRCRSLGVELRFESEVTDDAALADCDLVLAADGINSFVRTKYAQHFRPSIDWRTARFCWLGTTKRLETFTFVFRENAHGVFQVHAYPFQQEPALSTWIVECDEVTWHACGLREDDEAATVAYVRELFADHLEGNELLTNRSIWRRFPTVTCERWHHGNVALAGDAAHTAHFSIGSGTKLAMEDAIALARAFEEHGTDDVPRALAAYEDARRIDCLKLQRAARTSLQWFENSRRYVHQHPLQFTFNLLTRSKRITYDNLERRDPELVRRVREWWYQDQGAPRASDGSTPPPMFAPLRLRGLELANRVVVSPMCQYSAVDGRVGDWHLVHLGSRAVGGAGLVIAEMTNVSPEGCITRGCAGIWADEHVDAWRRIVEFVHAHSRARIGLQLGHAGRKGSCSLPWEGDRPLASGGWETLAPSAEPFDEDWPTPRAMDRADMQRVAAQYVRATERALSAGFDLLELHMAHGYLLSSFLSPLSNRRGDAYGGELEGRLRFPLEVFDAVRAAWPDPRPLAVRLSATDWLDDEGGLTLEDSVRIAQVLEEHGCDLIDVSSAGNTPRSRPNYGRMYQVPFAERIRQETSTPVMAVGAILGWDHVNTILTAGRADLCALARPHLVSPHLTVRAAVAYDYHDQYWPPQYLPAKPKP